ncbi:MAG: hypothetical protein Q8L48_26015 [Archangium sp.]|nr:hypothetical protein [Archangium sp.]
MRSSLCCFLLLAVSACGRGASFTSLPPDVVVAPPTVSNRVRLETGFEASDGFRFGDRALLTTRTLTNGRCPTEEVRNSDGALLEGEDARTELQTDSGRYLVLRVPGGSLCVTPPVGSLSEVDERRCTGWTPQHLLHLSFQPGENAAGTGLIVRTDRDQAYRVWIARSGFDEVALTDYVLFDFEARPAPATCAADAQPCVVRDDCCNTRHSCSSGVCQY